MNRRAVAAAILSTAAFSAAAQTSGVPEQKCTPKPTYPGLQALKSDVEVKAFQDQIKNYKECIMGYIAERRASSKAHDAAANAAADEHNKVMDKIRDDQEAARAQAERAREAQQKDVPTSPRAPGKY